MIEEHPEAEPPVGSRFRNLSRTIDSEELFRRLDQSMEDQVDERAYLAVRLMDLLVGDWDRHPDQWRWGLIAERDLQSPGAPRVWVPIPRDRDNAFSDVGGLVSHLANYFAPSMVQFRGEYPDLYRLVQNAAVLDRRILSPIPYDLWDEVALELRDQLTDAAISDAIAGLPVEWETLEREPLEARLRVRRDALPEVARQLRTMMVSEVEIYGTGEDDEARIERRPDGSVRVSLLATQHGGAVYFDRVFQPAHTRELRIHLGAGNDRAVVTGKGNEVTVRVLGGPGDDWFEDLSVTETPARTLFYDHEGDDHFAGSVTGKTLVDRRQPSSQRGDHPVFHSNAPPPRDWGARFTPLVPRIKWRSQIGPVVGAGPRWEEFGFRRQPEARRLDLAALYAPLHNRFGVEAEARWPRARVGESVRVSAYGSAINVTRFHGFGNDSPSADQVVDPLVWSTNYGFSAVAVEEGERGFEFSIGPAVHYLRPDAGSGSPASLEEGRGGDPFGVAGVEGAVVLDRRDSSSYPRRGVRMNLTAEGFPVAWGGVENGFASASIAGAAYLPIPAPGEMTLAVRAGAAAAGRNTPFQFAPALGGSSTLRGFHTHRFTGDGMLYWGAELRAYLMRGNLRFVKGEIGAIGLLDAGRVTGSIGSSAGWHYGKGGGLWFGVLDRSLTVHLVYARGERGGLYAGLGMPF
jgi:hypothetical protein